IITPDGVKSGYLYIDNRSVVGFGAEKRNVDECYDFTGKYVSAGFIDLHTHGGNGHPFINGTEEDVIEACNFHLSHGTTAILPTVTAGAFSAMRKAVETIAAAKNTGRIKSDVIGAHMEGPYLSAKQCGAQYPAFITPPEKEDYEKLVDDLGEYIARWTYAPENDKDGEFCKYITSREIIASAGHTDAKYVDMKTAIENGCNLVTHLYSCTSTVTRDHGFRSLGVIESTYLRDELTAEIIADGKHLPPDLIKMIIKIKGEEKTVVCTDSLEIAGTDIKEGIMSGTEFIVEDGVCKLKDRSAFAGSVATSDRLVKVLVKDCGMTVEKAVKTITENPAKILNVKKGKLKVGYDADIVVFDDDITITDIFVLGKKVV
ncbi:MAG: N-acetylglucosamine-6-phosphate deacetylase, partial [Candidatus Scatosoma sp.]